MPKTNSFNSVLSPMKLTVQLKPKQVEAANRIHARLPDWRLIDDALEFLARNAPGFSPEATLLKVAAVNSLYGTRSLRAPYQGWRQAIRQSESCSRGT